MKEMINLLNDFWILIIIITILLIIIYCFYLEYRDSEKYEKLLLSDIEELNRKLDENDLNYQRLQNAFNELKDENYKNLRKIYELNQKV